MNAFEDDFYNVRAKIFKLLGSKYEDILDYWKSDTGCRYIQEYLNDKPQHHSVKVRAREAVEQLDSIFQLIVRNKLVLDEPLTLYRGSRIKHEDGIYNGFLPLTHEEYETEAYGQKSTFHVAADVPWIPFSTEHEILLPRGCYITLVGDNEYTVYKHVTINHDD
jgi:hypothetical protein